MSGTGLARCSWGNISRAGLGACVAGADVAIIGDQRLHVGSRLVAGPIPWQLVGFCPEEPGYGNVDGIHVIVRCVVDWTLRFAGLLGENPL